MPTTTTLMETYDCLDENIGLTFEQIRVRLRVKRELPQNPPKNLLKRIGFYIRDPLPESLNNRIYYLVCTGAVIAEGIDRNSNTSETVYRKVLGQRPRPEDERIFAY